MDIFQEFYNCWIWLIDSIFGKISQNEFTQYWLYVQKLHSSKISSLSFLLTFCLASRIRSFKYLTSSACFILISWFFRLSDVTICCSSSPYFFVDVSEMLRILKYNYVLQTEQARHFDWLAALISKSYRLKPVHQYYSSLAQCCFSTYGILVFHRYC